MSYSDITSHSHSTPRHTTGYLAAGPLDGPLIIFTHGWPELSRSWRHQLPFFAAMGFRAIAPDIRGYGHSSVYPEHKDYSVECAVLDMVDLHDALGGGKAIWVGHDWGSPVAWGMGAHHPGRCIAIASLCVPYATIDRGFDVMVPLIDRSVYLEKDYPLGQWEYMGFYEENFQRATAQMDTNARNMAQLIFRKGSAQGRGLPSGTAMVRKNNGWFGGLPVAPDMPMDEDVITPEDLSVYAEALQRNGIFGPNSWYMNHEVNAAFFDTLPNAGRMDLPALFIHARYDYTCETVDSQLAEPMRSLCSNLTETTIDSGHWMAQEKPMEVNRHIAKWILNRVPELA